MGNMKISIILPIYNVAKYLPRCVDSVLNQTLKDIEIILATDGPEDCDAICAEYAKKDARVKIISHPGSYGKAVNEGIKVATGEYIGIVETDDWCDSTMFERLYCTAKKFDADVSKASFYRVKKHKMRRKDFSQKTELLTPGKNKDFFWFVPSLWSAIYRTEFLKKNQIFFIEDRLSFIDTPFVLETFVRAKRFVYLPETLYFYNCGNPEASVKSSGKVLDAVKAEDFFYNKVDSEVFAYIKKQYLVGLASRLMWNFKRFNTDEDRCLFWKAAHIYVTKMGITNDDLSLFSDEYLKQFLVSLNKLENYKDCAKVTCFKKEFKLFGLPLLKKEVIAWKETNFYLFNVFPLFCVKTENGNHIYKLFGFLRIHKKRRVLI